MKKSSVLIITAFIITLLFGSIVGNAAVREPETTYYKYYTSIMIQPGDNLWDIAEAQNPESHCTTADYVKELMRINGLESDEIHAGQHLTVFYYDSQLK